MQFAHSWVRVRAVCGAAAVGMIVTASFERPVAQRLPEVLPPPFAGGSLPDEFAQVCGTLDPAAEAALRLRPRTVLQDNIPISFDQDPVLLTADYGGAVTLRNFLITGDIQAIQFKPVIGDIETWTRAGVTQVGNRTLSVFSPSWNQQRVSAAFEQQEVGFDYPYLYWGQVLPPGAEGIGYGVYLRLLSNAIPPVTVAQAAEGVQFSSAVVNIRSDDFGNTQLLDDENAYGFDKITKRFYEVFQDTYDSIGITTASTRATTPTLMAFHQRVKNDVKGIGLPIFDNSRAYGSAGRLSGIEFFTAAAMTTNRSVAHETAHRWGAFIDWAKLTGITLAGHQPTAHDPLMSGGETRIGAVLDGTRRVDNVDGTWMIQRTPAPILFHPYTLYAMGVLAPEAVPEVTMFEEQGQFNSTSVATPPVRTVIKGNARTATVFNVIGMLGPREGPVPATWDQALIVVSSGRLLSRREMDYWTFYAQRTADPNGSGVNTWLGHGSFDAATSRRIDLTHEIRPRDRDPIREPLPVDAPPLLPSDFREILPDTSIATLYDVGERFRVSGRVTATDHDFTTIGIGLYRDPGGEGNRVIAYSTVGTHGSFDVAFPIFTSAQKGQWIIEVFLFWPNSGSQYARLFLGPVTVR